MSFKDLILKETPQYLAINKPSGLIVEKNPYESPTIEDLALEYLQSTKPNAYLGIVHRLDRVTSGVLLLAKKKSVLKALNEQFSLRKVQKTYLALVENLPSKSKTMLIHWLEKDLQNKRAIIHNSPSKKAIKCQLSYRLLQQNAMGYLLEVQPLTGKFHQIRAQLAAIGCPIVGDEKYGAAFNAKFGKESIALHAHRLKFRNTISGKWENIEVESDFELL